MTESSTFKRRVRERMAKTGERYTTARSQMAKKRDRNQAARRRLSAADERPSAAVVERETGRTWDQWFGILDRWGGREKTHRQTAVYLREERGVPGWWAQTVTVWYQRTRGMRLKHQQADGFTISASKTIGVPVKTLYDMFVDARRRKRWLPEATMRLRTSQPTKGARFDWEDGSTRLAVWFAAKGPSKSQVALSHEKLPDADDAETMKAMWRERLAELKTVLER